MAMPGGPAAARWRSGRLPHRGSRARRLSTLACGTLLLTLLSACREDVQLLPARDGGVDATPDVGSDGTVPSSDAGTDGTVVGPGSWTETGSLSVGRGEHTAVLLAGGEVLVFGGWNKTASLVEAERYVPSTGSWRLTGPLSQPRVAHAAALLPSGRVLAAGGSGAPATYEIYDPVGETRSEVAFAPLIAIQYAAAPLTDGAVLAGPEANYLFVEATEEWAPVGLLAEPRGAPTATVLAATAVLFVGGTGREDGVPSAAADVYDPRTRAFTPTGPLTQARAGHTATVVTGGRVLVVGGRRDTGGLAQAEVYDPDAQTFGPAASPTILRYEHTATLLRSGRVLVVGGTGPQGSLASVEIYSPRTDTWSAGAPLHHARTGHSATRLLDGRVLVVGGYGPDPAATAELFTEEGGLD